MIVSGRLIGGGGSSGPLSTGSAFAAPQQRRRKAAPIDRAGLVRRHNPVVRNVDPLSPLSLGNGEFAFTADVTGLQTFPREYESGIPLCTMSQWGWHTSQPQGFDPSALRLTGYDTHGRAVGYATSSDGQVEIYNWLRENPHRLHLGRIGLRVSLPGEAEAQATDLSDIHQELDLWTGILTKPIRRQERAGHGNYRSSSRYGPAGPEDRVGLNR